MVKLGKTVIAEGTEKEGRRVQEGLRPGWLAGLEAEADAGLAGRLEKVEKWFLSKERDLVSVGLGPGTALRVVMRRSVVHPRGEDEVVELPAVFREIYTRGVRDAERTFQMQARRLFGVEG